MCYLAVLPLLDTVTSKTWRPHEHCAFLVHIPAQSVSLLRTAAEDGGSQYFWLKITEGDWEHCIFLSADGAAVGSDEHMEVGMVFYWSLKALERTYNHDLDATWLAGLHDCRTGLDSWIFLTQGANTMFIPVPWSQVINRLDKLCLS